jgi:hypothetical protein
MLILEEKERISWEDLFNSSYVNSLIKQKQI